MKRPIVGGEYQYSGHKVHVEYMGPDYLSFVDDMQVGQFWLDAFSADKAAREEIDRKEMEKSENV